MKLEFIPFEEDRFFTKFGSVLPWDKVEHIIREMILYLVISYFLDDLLVLYLIELFGVSYEIKDGYFNDGFSLMDLLANQIGIGLGLIIGIYV